MHPLNTPAPWVIALIVVTIVMLGFAPLNKAVAKLLGAPDGSSLSAHLYRLTAVRKGLGLIAWPLRLYVDAVCILDWPHCKSKWEEEGSVP